jgi:hypothetical protein
MNNDEIAELLIRVDERGKRLESKFDAHAVTTEKRLDSHARDIKTLREWKMDIESPKNGWQPGPVALVPLGPQRDTGRPCLCDRLQGNNRH